MVNTKLREVQAFKTSDGALFEDEAQATLRQARLDFGVWYSENRISGTYAGSTVAEEELFEWLFVNRDRVAQILGLAVATMQAPAS